MENNLEGYNKTVKTFTGMQKDIFTNNGIRGALGQLINVNNRYSTAMK